MQDQDKETKTFTLSIDYSIIPLALSEVFRSRLYVVLTVVLALIFLVIVLLLPGLSSLKFAFSAEYFDWKDKLAVVKEVIFMVGQAYTILQKSLIIIGVILMSVNFSMLVYLVRKRAGVLKTSGISIAGAAAGALGLGCSACGSFVLASFIGVTGAAGVLGSLPLKGSEFGIVSIFLILLSIYLIAQKVRAPLICSN